MEFLVFCHYGDCGSNSFIQTNRQIRLGNKQHLFDMRIEYYLIAKGMMQLFDKNSNILDEDKKNDMLAIEFVFAKMTNNTYLEKIFIGNFSSIGRTIS